MDEYLYIRVQRKNPKEPGNKLEPDAEGAYKVTKVEKTHASSKRRTGPFRTYQDRVLSLRSSPKTKRDVPKIIKLGKLDEETEQKSEKANMNENLYGKGEEINLLRRKSVAGWWEAKKPDYD